MRTNIKNILLAVTAINYYALIIKFSNLFKTYQGKDAVYNFINSMIKESKYCSDGMKKHFNKELGMTREDNKDLENSTEFWDNDYIDNNVKVRDHCHITRKYKDTAHRDCNINVKLNNKIPVKFQNLTNYDFHVIKQEID